jgi:predicted PP-loop superfamily ATPase
MKILEFLLFSVSGASVDCRIAYAFACRVINKLSRRKIRISQCRLLIGKIQREVRTAALNTEISELCNLIP